jgi:hypothetical protein
MVRCSRYSDAVSKHEMGITCELHYVLRTRTEAITAPHDFGAQILDVAGGLHRQCPIRESAAMLARSQRRIHASNECSIGFTQP